MKITKIMRNVAIVTMAISFAGIAQAADTIKVGVLHSLSGTMAISETVCDGIGLSEKCAGKLVPRLCYGACQ